jgi:hypothetical protein
MSADPYTWRAKTVKWLGFVGIFAFGILAGIGIPTHNRGLMGALSLLSWIAFSRMGRLLKARATLSNEKTLR